MAKKHKKAHNMSMSVGGILLRMYATLGSAILAGILNMAWCKANFLKPLQKPLDAGKKYHDGKRIFGDNKTWKGLVGYILLNSFSMVLFGAIFQALNWNQYSFIYQNHANTPLFNLWVGALIGLVYALFELPNSFLKRRLGIKPGKTAKGWLRAFFVFLDQADSIFGLCLVVCIFYAMSPLLYLAYVLVGAATHILINILLYFAHLRKNMF